MPTKVQPPPITPTYSTEEIVKAIKDISDATKKMLASQLKQKTLVLLISHHSCIAQRDVNYILNTLDQLESIYLK